MAHGRDRVQAVERAFAILESLVEAPGAGRPGQEGALTLAEIATASKLAPATVHRLIRTLVDLGYVNQRASREYALGPALIKLGEKATPPLADAARPLLVKLEEVACETANLAVLDGDLVAYVAQVPSRHSMRMFTEVGTRVLPHASGVGKAMLANLPSAQVLEIVQRTGLPMYTPSTLTTEEALLGDLAETRQRGYALDDGEQEIGVKCVAVAIPGRHLNRTVGIHPAAISISGPAARMTDEVVTRSIQALTAASRRLRAS